MVILKLAVALSAGTVPMSLPDTTTAYVPTANPFGTVNVHAKVPVAEVVFVVQVCPLGVTPLNVMEPIAVSTENPEPVTVTAVPCGPLVGDRVIVGVVTVNVAVAVSAGTVPTSLPDRMTAYGPSTIDGTVNVHVKVPVGEVVFVVQVCPLGVAPLNVMVPIAVRTENPEPVAVTEVPTGPWMGDSVIVGVVTVKVVEAVSPGTVQTSLPDRMTVYVPDANDDDTVNVHVNVPVTEVVWESHVCVVGATPSSVIEPNAMPTENPEPVTVTEVSTGAWVTDSVIVGVVNLNVAVAASAGTVPTSLPDRTTVYVPAAIDGAVNVHVKVPVAEVVWDVQVCPLGVTPLNVMVPIAVRTENPEPCTVTETPSGP